MKSLVETDTIIGKKIITEQGDCVIPISKVIVGYVGGGGEYFDVKVKKNDKPFAMGCGAGAYVKPIGFLILSKDGASNFIKIDNQINIEKIAEYLKDLLGKINEGEQND